ncbi:MAG: hypothetical protein GWO24_21880 [Akkermansiaceae bacterium]|nr:hypothetical protein [Akkermansiaceae bacterium]
MGKELEGLTVAALAGESAKAQAGADGAGDAEPVSPAGAGEPAVSADAETAIPKAEPEGGEPDGGEGESAALAPEVKALVEAQVEAAVAGVRAEYEESGGHLSKLRSKKDKEIARLRKQLDEREQADYQEALELAQRQPEQAVERLAGMVQGMQSRRALEQQEQELQAWAGGVLEELGLDPEDDAVQEVAARVGPLTGEGASYAYLGEMGKLAREQEAGARKKAERELAQTLEGLPGMVNAAVAKAMAASGLGTVDGSEQQAPAQDNPIKNVDSPSRLLAMGWKAVGRKR